MINRLMELPYWRLELKDFKSTKKKIKTLIKKYPLTKEGVQNYSSNTNLFKKDKDKHQQFIKEVSLLIMNELEAFSKEIKKDLKIIKAWSVRYKKGEDQSIYHYKSFLDIYK